MTKAIKYKRIANSGGVQGLGGSGGSAPTYVDLDPVISQTNTPPAHVAGERYLVGTVPTGAWVGNGNSIAESDGISWTYTVPTLNDYVYITSLLVTMRYNGSAWVAAAGRAILQNGNIFSGTGARIGTNDTGPLWLKTNNVLKFRIDGTNADIRTVGSLKVGNLTTAPATGVRLHVVGSGSTNTTTNLKLDNLAGTELFIVLNDGTIGINQPIPTSRLHIVGTALENTLKLDNSTYNISFFPSGTSTLSEITTTNIGYQISSVDGYFRLTRGGSGPNLIYINAGTGLALSGIAAGTHQIFLRSNGHIQLPAIQTGNAGLVAGDTYKDTAANILANGDLIVAVKA